MSHVAVLQGLRSGCRDRIQVRPQAMLEAKDLPANHLSSLLEQKVLNALAADRQQRAVQQVRCQQRVLCRACHHKLHFLLLVVVWGCCCKVARVSGVMGLLLAVVVLQGKPLDMVPTADGLTIRVINNVIKKCEVSCLEAKESVLCCSHRDMIMRRVSTEGGLSSTAVAARA